MNIAIIPARGGSKRIPRKNIKLFAGKPMIGYAIEAALASNTIEHVVVSTDDEQIAEVARESGAEVPFLRPAHLADDFTPTVPVIAHAIEACQALGWSIDYACCIYPGVPFIRNEDIEAALALLIERGSSGYAFPVAEYPSPIQRALKRDANGALAPFDPSQTITRTQDLEPAFYDAGQFYWGSAQGWSEGLDIHANAHSIILPASRVVDIDTPDDWARAEALFAVLDKGGV
ncbi:MAG: pseudaminic acid cytidylyltransferase [Pseudomonadota bacterium]